MDNLQQEITLKIIKEIGDILAPGWAFGCYTVEDIKQEISLECWKALPNYNPNKGASLRTFLFGHARKRLITLKRNKFARPAPKSISPEEMEAWGQKYASKISLMETAESVPDQHIDNDDFVEATQFKELCSLIDRELPVEYRLDYKHLLDGVRLPKHRRVKLLNILKSIVNVHTGEEEGEAE